MKMYLTPFVFPTLKVKLLAVVNALNLLLLRYNFVIPLKCDYLAVTSLSTSKPQCWGLPMVESPWCCRKSGSCSWHIRTLCTTMYVNARPLWLEVSLPFLRIFCQNAISQIASLSQRFSSVKAKSITYVRSRMNYSLVLNSQIGANLQ